VYGCMCMWLYVCVVLCVWCYVWWMMGDVVLVMMWGGDICGSVVLVVLVVVGVLVMVVVGVSGDLAIYVWLCGEGGMA